MSAAIKRSSEKHVVCHKTLVAKQDQARFTLLRIRTVPYKSYTLSAIEKRLTRVPAFIACCRLPEQARLLSRQALCAQVDKVAEMCKDIMDFSQGKASQRSAGIMEFQVSVDQYEPHVFYFWERYEGNASLGRHNTSPEIRAFMENVRRTWLVCAARLPLDDK